MPDARCVSLPNPAVAASACTNIYNSTACTQRACYTRRVRWRRSAPRMRPTLLFWPASTYSSSFAAPATLHCLPPPDHVLPFITASHHLAVQRWATRQQRTLQRRANSSARELCMRTTRPRSALVVALLHALICKCNSRLSNTAASTGHLRDQDCAVSLP